MWLIPHPDEQFLQELLIRVAAEGEALAPSDMQTEQRLLWVVGILDALEHGRLEPAAIWKMVAWFASRKGRLLDAAECVDDLPRDVRDALIDVAVAMRHGGNEPVSAGEHEQELLCHALWNAWGPEVEVSTRTAQLFGKLILKGFEGAPFTTLEAIRRRSLPRLIEAVAYSAGYCARRAKG